MTSSNNKPTTFFWIISVIALVWNAMGVFAYLGQAYMTDEALALLPEAEQNFYTNLPAWVTAAFAIAVFAGALGCLGLLLRKKWAGTLFILSLLGVLVQFVYNFFLQDFMPVEGTSMIWSFVLILIAILLIAFARKSAAKGWLS